MRALHVAEREIVRAFAVGRSARCYDRVGLAWGPWTGDEVFALFRLAALGALYGVVDATVVTANCCEGGLVRATLCNKEIF